MRMKQEMLLDEVGGDETVLRDSQVLKYENLEGNKGVRVTLADGRCVCPKIVRVLVFHHALIYDTHNAFAL
jgi:hypothetical protein